MGAILLKQGLIEMRQLRDGQIAVIAGSNYNGRIVQRYGNSGVTIGHYSGNGWEDIRNNTLLVKVLSDGELIEVFDNGQE
jgi:hypothetical protein